MFVFKPINKSDVSITETIIYKTQALHSGSSGLKSVQYRSGSKNQNSDFKHTESGSYWNSLHTLFYQSGSALREAESLDFNKWSYSLAHPHANNPQYVNKFYSSGSIISIPQQYFGERIKPRSFKLIDNSTSKEVTIQDDGHGNLYPVGHTISQSVTSPSSSDNYVGNIFYDYGIVTITDTGSYSASINYTDVGTNDYTLVLQATQTIYTHEYIVTIEPKEYNYTMNATIKDFYSGSNFNKINESQYIASKFTGSNWSPYVNSIHLYSEHDRGLGTYDVGRNKLIPLTEPIIIANLPRPIKIRNDMSMTFKIRLDI